MCFLSSSTLSLLQKANIREQILAFSRFRVNELIIYLFSYMASNRRRPLFLQGTFFCVLGKGG
jgi:hypothetical protein